MATRVMVLVCALLLAAGAARGAEKARAPARAPAAEAAGKAVGGLRLILKMDKATYAEGDAWAGSVTATNESDKPIAVDTMSGAAVKFLPVNGKEPKVTMHIGMGLRGKDTGKPTFPTIEPGQSLTIARFDPSPQPEHVLATTVGGAMNAWDAAAGTYKMVFTYKMTEAEAKALGMESPWTGEVESNVVAIAVAPKKAKVTPVGGLALYLDIRTLGEGENRQVNGRARLVNVSEKPIVIDARAASKIEFVDAAGKAVQGTPLPIPLAEMGERLVTVKPGDWLSVAKFYILKGATMVQANPMTAYGLPVGRYTLRASYAETAAAAADAKEKPWTGTLQSNEETIDIQTSNAPAK